MKIILQAKYVLYTFDGHRNQRFTQASHDNFQMADSVVFITRHKTL